MNELNQALENINFLRIMLMNGTYNFNDSQKAVNAMRFIQAIETGIKAKMAEPGEDKNE